MADIKIKTLCTRNGLVRKDVDKAIKRLGIQRVKVKGVLHISAEDANILLNELELPKELTPIIVTGRVLEVCRNPMWVMCKFEGDEYKKPCLLPRRHIGRFPKGKTIRAERIEDAEGVTYRHEYFSRIERR